MWLDRSSRSPCLCKCFRAIALRTVLEDENLAAQVLTFLYCRYLTVQGTFAPLSAVFKAVVSNALGATLILF